MKTFTKVYDSYGQAQQAVNDLEAQGVSSSDISLVANKHVSAQYDNVDDSSEAGTGASLGAAVGGGAGLLTGLGIMAIPGLGPVVAAGWLASTALGVAAGAAAGGLIGSLVNGGEDEDTANVYSESVRRGGTLVTVRTENGHAQDIQDILNSHQPIDAAARGAEYRADGWTRFDAKAAAYRPSDTEVEQIRRKYTA